MSFVRYQVDEDDDGVERRCYAEVVVAYCQCYLLSHVDVFDDVGGDEGDGVVVVAAEAVVEVVVRVADHRDAGVVET